MNKNPREPRLSSKINTAKDRVIFSDAQLQVFNSEYTDGLDEALALLDEPNKTVIGQTKSFEVNVDRPK